MTAAVEAAQAVPRKAGRPSTAAPFAGLVREMLTAEPLTPSSAILEAAQARGYEGGKSALYAMVATVRAETGIRSPAEVRASETAQARAAKVQKEAEREAARAQQRVEDEALSAQKKARREQMHARWAAEAEERQQRKARARELWFSATPRSGHDQRLSDAPVFAPIPVVPEPPSLCPPPQPNASGGGMDGLEGLRVQIAALTQILASQAATIERLTAAPAQKQTTISELCEAYQKIRRADTSWNCIRARLNPLARRLGGLRVSELTPTVWAEHLAVRKTQLTLRDKPPSDQTLNVELQRTKEMIDWGVNAGLVTTNALKLAKKVKTISARETFLTEPQIQQLLGGISDLPTMHAQLVTRAFILCALDGMMRASEVRHLRRDRIGPDGVVELQAKQTKSRKRRMVALTPRALAALIEIPPVEGTQHIFANPETGKLYGRSSIFAWFRVACIASKVDAYAAEGERVVIHTLRHSGASAADARGASPLAIKEALGHSSLAVSEKYMHRHRENSARELAKLMAAGAEAEGQKGAA